MNEQSSKTFIVTPTTSYCIEEMLKQQLPPVRMELKKKKRISSFQKDEKKVGVDEQVLDLSGMSLETLPFVISPSLNIALVTTLDLSSNFLQVCFSWPCSLIFLFAFVDFILYIFIRFLRF